MFNIAKIYSTFLKKIQQKAQQKNMCNPSNSFVSRAARVDPSYLVCNLSSAPRLLQNILIEFHGYQPCGTGGLDK